MQNELGHTMLAEHIIEIEEGKNIKPPMSECMVISNWFSKERKTVLKERVWTIDI